MAIFSRKSEAEKWAERKSDQRYSGKAAYDKLTPEQIVAAQCKANHERNKRRGR